MTANVGSASRAPNRIAQPGVVGRQRWAYCLPRVNPQGRAIMATMKIVDHQAARQLLEQRAQQLRAELRSVQTDRNQDQDAAGRETVHDAGEQGEQLSRDEVRRSEQQRDADELRDITAALLRMDEGHYGQCVDCAAKITASRLQVQPAAMRCIKCQEKHEQAPPPTVGAGRPG